MCVVSLSRSLGSYQIDLESIFLSSSKDKLNCMNGARTRMEEERCVRSMGPLVALSVSLTGFEGNTQTPRARGRDESERGEEEDEKLETRI